MAKNFIIPMSNGIFSHWKRMGEALWLFMWYIDKTTREELEQRRALNRARLRWRPVPDSRPAHDMGCTKRVIGIWRRRLRADGYISTLRTPIGRTVKVRKSKKWLREVFVSQRLPATSSTETKKRCTKLVGQIYENGISTHPNGISNIDNAVTVQRQYSDRTPSKEQSAATQPPEKTDPYDYSRLTEEQKAALPPPDKAEQERMVDRMWERIAETPKGAALMEKMQWRWGLKQ